MFPDEFYHTTSKYENPYKEEFVELKSNLSKAIKSGFIEMHKQSKVEDKDYSFDIEGLGFRNVQFTKGVISSDIYLKILPKNNENWPNSIITSFKIPIYYCCECPRF